MKYTKEQMQRAFIYLTDCNLSRLNDDCTSYHFKVKQSRENIFINIVNNFNIEYNNEMQRKNYKFVKTRLINWLCGLGVDIAYCNGEVTEVLQNLLFGYDDERPFTVSVKDDWTVFLDLLAETIIFYADVYNLRIGDKYALNAYNDSAVKFIGTVYADKNGNYILRIDIANNEQTKGILNYRQFNCGEDFAGKRKAKGIANENNIELLD